MSGIRIERAVVRNFKCHKDFTTDLKSLNILTGSNAAGKSSFVQALLLAFKTWEVCDKRRINTNNVYGVNLGLPISIASEDLDERDIEIGLYSGGMENKVVLGLGNDDEKLHFEICNYEEIMEKRTSASGLNRMRLFFLSAERQGPRIISVLHDTVSHSVGNTGQNTSYILGEMDKQQKLDPNFQLPKDLKISAIDRFSANCEEWLDFIVPGTRIQYGVDMERNFTTLMVKNQGEFHLPVATGFGITYVLPVIVQALAASVVKNSVMIVENPEAHLHPLSQSRLGKLLGFVAANGVQVILETHSEHIVDGCRIQIAKEHQCDNMKILFFEKRENISSCKDIRIQSNGELEEWPKGFFDQKRMDLRELLEMRRCGN